MIDEKGIDHRLSSVCDSCPAHCCSRSYGYVQISLTPEERQNPLFLPHLSDSKGLKMEGRYCRFLDVLTHRCTIYNQRPVACRGFVCYDVTNQGDAARALVRRNKKLRDHLEEHGVLPTVEKDMYWVRDYNRMISRPQVEPIAWPPHPDWYEAGTFTLFKLEAATGKILKVGRYRSTRRETTIGKYLGMYLDKKFDTGFGSAKAMAIDCESVEDHAGIAIHDPTNYESSDITEACPPSAQ